MQIDSSLFHMQAEAAKMLIRKPNERDAVLKVYYLNCAYWILPSIQGNVMKEEFIFMEFKELKLSSF